MKHYKNDKDNTIPKDTPIKLRHKVKETLLDILDGVIDLFIDTESLFKLSLILATSMIVYSIILGILTNVTIELINAMTDFLNNLSM